MTIEATILDKLKNYEYEKNDYQDAVDDIYALIHHIADLEDDLQAARAFTPRDIAGGAESRGLADRTIAIDAHESAWGRCGEDKWFPLRILSDEAMVDLPKEGAPYTVVYEPGRRG